MIGMTNAYDWRDRTVIDRNGEKIGKIDELYLDHQTDKPEWASVHTGLLGTKRSFVPLAGATPKGEDVQVPVSKEQVKGAPGVEPDRELSEREEIEYVVTEEVQQTVPVRREEVRVEREPITDANIDRATDGPAISEGEHEVVLHEEEVVTEKRAVPKERVRLDKDVITEEQQVSDEVRKEQIDVDTGHG